ncbi:MAG TPA: MDR family MFS transporter [Intrasporangium sp.]|uniref:MDR family MFS transporter n=1 Tax=Intrasporangium sp. TaxID=1925024 RepID=UPI002D76E13E|nr:MDR family MFS transporter [Intrasporangium sp.]HET7397974.1 MDR family MFS transporter [Intrasporangium sp.]
MPRDVPLLHPTVSETEVAPVRRRDVGLRSERGPVLLAVMLSTALVALDQTIVATAVPSIVRDLGGFSEFPWLFSLYLLAQAATVPVYGKLADLFGRRPLMYFGIAAFLVGSVLCGAAWSMPVLIAARALQGLGAGAVQPIGMTIIGDIYSLRERAKVQGYVASVWGISSVIGPTVGGLFSQLLSWRFIFWVNIPLCVLAAWMLRRFQERLARTAEGRPRVDYLGAALLTAATTLLVLGLLEGGQRWPWAGWQTAAIFGSAAALFGVFALVERRVADPILPVWVFRSRTLQVTSALSLLVGGLILGLSSYVPTLGQEVAGATAIVSGFTLAALTLGWPVAAAISGRLYLSIGFRTTGLLGVALAVAGSIVLVVGPVGSLGYVALACTLIGFGMGWVAAPALVVAQASVAWGDRGVATATNMFARSFGSAIGVAVFGAVVNAVVGAHPSAPLLATGIHRVFVGILVLAIGMGLLELLMPVHLEKTE